LACSDAAETGLVFQLLGTYPSAYPSSASLLQGSDGNLYGTTAGDAPYGGINYGTVFKFTPGGVLTTMAAFQNTNGSLPDAALVQGSDGNFYGTTVEGGDTSCPFGCGTIFKITPGGTLTTLFAFNSLPVRAVRRTGA